MWLSGSEEKQGIFLSLSGAPGWLVPAGCQALLSIIQAVIERDSNPLEKVLTLSSAEPSGYGSGSSSRHDSDPVRASLLAKGPVRPLNLLLCNSHRQCAALAQDHKISHRGIGQLQDLCLMGPQ
ncbi:putative uncharacterized protein [Pseudomonas sp. StFLB209]|nr:putative uncharacterized protein [Pseudomonas sp. StFLB209]